MEPEVLIAFLNHYSGAIIASIHRAGGDVLKPMRDGTLAVFQASDATDACRCALGAYHLAQERLGALNAERAAQRLPTTADYFCLHVGEVFYCNFGSHNRLDLTVVRTPSTR